MDAKSILIINYYFPPINNGGVQRTANFMKYLPRFGFNVGIVTTNSFGTIANEDERKVFRFPDSGIDYTNSDHNARILKFLFRVFRRAQLYFGFITDGKYYWEKNVLKEIDRIMSSNHYDMVLASYPTPANLEIGEFIHDRYSIPLIVDYRDGLTYDPFPQFKKSSILFRKRVDALEKRVNNKASLILTVNEQMNMYYSANYKNVESVLIPNGFDDEEIVYEKPLSLPTGINVVYTGGIGKSRVIYSVNELTVIFESLCTVADNINFIFIGEYTDAEREIFNKYKNVKVYNKQSRQVALATQQIADALLLLSGPEGCTSGKLYEYMFAEKPIINIGGKKGIAELINGTDFGCTFSPNDKEGIKNFLNCLTRGDLSFKYEKKNLYTRRKQSENLACYIQKFII